MKLFLIGGFLGSGKTTAIINACRYLIKNNVRLAVITNDQGEQQVDSAFVKSFSIASAEVGNGCFCCNYDQLNEHIRSFSQSINPDIVFAESVGSCTDLIATVVKPFAMAMPDSPVVISVFADASLLLAFFEGRASFINENVRYIYKKQLEEADVLVINKADLVTVDQLSIIENVLLSGYASKIILYQDSHDENNIRRWIETLNEFHQPSQRSSLEIDYDLYGDGEAQLAWLDKSITIIVPQQNAIQITNEIMLHICNYIRQRDFVTGHLKFFIEAPGWQRKISVTTLSSFSDFLPEQERVGQIRMLINARVQTEPSVLKDLVNDTLKQMVRKYGCIIMVEKWSAFKPGYPKPTYRIS